MKRSLFGAVAALAIGVPGIAAADTGGNVRFTYATLDESGDPDKEDATAFSGAVVTDIGASGWRLQFDGASADMNHGDHSDAFSLVQVHGAYDFGNFSVGGFTGQFNTGESYWLYGLEASAQIGRFGVSASASGADPVNSDFSEERSNVSLNGSFNMTDRFYLTANGSWSDFGYTNTDTYGIGAGYAFESGLTLGIGWRTTDFDDSTTDALGVSVGWSFGEGGARSTPGAIGLLQDAVAIQ